jgi:nucleoid-associated protein YgaU
LVGAETALSAARQAEASTYASTVFANATAKLEDARAKASDPCAYRKTARLAREAKIAAEQAKTVAVADKRQREEEARRRAEEKARQEAKAEARRRAEEGHRTKHPPIYIVEKGDCLWAISGMRKIYTDSRLWPLIFDANSGKIQDPDLIYPEQELSIPRELSDEQMQERLFELWGELRQTETEVPTSD